MKTKPCLNCKKTIIKRQNESLKDWETRHKFCSRSCSAKFNKVYLNGAFTKERHYVPPTAIKKGQHLSHKTQFKKNIVPWNKNTTGLMNTWNKGKRFPQISGEKHFNWKGGISTLASQIRNLPEMKVWRTLVFQKGNYKCDVCPKTGKGLQVHHIKSFASILRDNNISSVEMALSCVSLWDIENGQILCLECHKKTDTYLTFKSFKPETELSNNLVL